MASETQAELQGGLLVGTSLYAEPATKLAITVSRLTIQDRAKVEELEERVAQMRASGQEAVADTLLSAHLSKRYHGLTLGPSPPPLPAGAMVVDMQPWWSHAALVATCSDGARHATQLPRAHLIVGVDGAKQLGDVRAVWSALLRAKGEVVTLHVRRPHQLVAEYELHELLGSGNFGTVHRATLRPREGDAGDAELGATKEVAVKTISTAAIGAYQQDMLRREVQVLRLMAHPGACGLIATFEEPGAGELQLVMELCRGGDLQRVLDKRGAVGEAEGRHVMKQLCEVVAFMHGIGVIHRDIKPANVMIVDGPRDALLVAGSLESPARVKLVDFGIGRVIAPKKARRKLPRPKLKHVRRISMGQPPKAELVGTMALTPEAKVKPPSSSALSSRGAARQSPTQCVVGELEIITSRGDLDATQSARDADAIDVEVSLAGSPLYQAPEIRVKQRNKRGSTVAMRTDDVSMTAKMAYAVDVYSLGRTLLHMLTGLPPSSAVYRHVNTSTALVEGAGGIGGAGGGSCCGGSPVVRMIGLRDLSADACAMLDALTRADCAQRPDANACLQLAFVRAA